MVCEREKERNIQQRERKKESTRYTDKAGSWKRNGNKRK